MVQVPVQVLRSSAVGPSPWILQGDDPNVVVVEQPLEGGVVDPRDGSKLRAGCVDVTVRPGARAVVTPTVTPWRVGIPSDEAVMMREENLKEGLRLSWQKARLSTEAVGVNSVGPAADGHNAEIAAEG